MTTSVVKVDAMPSLEIDAISLTFNEVTIQPEHKLDPILNKLTCEDYRSIFFLLIDTKFKKEEFLFWVKQEKDVLKNRFLNLYFLHHPFKDALLMEIFGTMQKYDVLKFLGTCSHIFAKDKDTFTQLNPLWKFLYTLCEQLEDGTVLYLKEQLFPENSNINVCCTEELMCQAFVKGKLNEKNWKSRLSDILKSYSPSFSTFITSYKGSNLNYYPLRRPTKTAPCGIAVIMNHVKFDGLFEDRLESNSDADALKKLWESFGFKTEIHTDLTAIEVYKVFLNLSKKDHSNYDAFVACYLSHGDDGIVVAKDGIANKLNDLIDLIANECETLVGKPKLFFVQACQGRGIQTGFGTHFLIPNTQVPIKCLTFDSQVPTPSLSRNVALRSDVLIVNSSIEGYVSFRGWLVADLVSNMQKYGEELPLTNVLTKVVKGVTMRVGKIKNTDFTKCKQTPVLYNTLNYELKFKKNLYS